MKFDFDKYFEDRYKDKPGYNEFMEFMNSESNHVGNEFLSTRISMGISQKKASDYLGLSLNDYIMIESGASSMEISTLKKYLKKLSDYKNSFFSSFNLSSITTENPMKISDNDNFEYFEPLKKIAITFSV